MNNADLKNKIFIVTGASSGIGKATAVEAVARGARVAFVARREKELSALSSQLSADAVAVIAADVTIESDRRNRCTDKRRGHYRERND
jgi:NADP-dependent 3-hydroxy acid dehydrogenase YdfG